MTVAHEVCAVRELIAEKRQQYFDICEYRCFFFRYKELAYSTPFTTFVKNITIIVISFIVCFFVLT